MTIISKEKMELWKSHIEKYKKSGLSGSEYCRVNNLSYHKLKYWTRRLKRIKNSDCQFVEITNHDVITSAPPAILYQDNQTKKVPDNHLDLYIHDSMKIRLTQDFDPLLLQKVLKVVGEVSCK